MIIAGIMTGTSVDGVDISVRDMPSMKSLGFFSFDFSDKEIKYIKEFLWPNKKNMAEIAEMNFIFSKIVAKYFNKLPNEVKEKIDYITYHGQTTFHDPNKLINKHSSTMQLGNGGALAFETKKNVIADLRSTDVAAGGQGAPLVMYGDKMMFWNKKDQTVVFNIGGISNVSIIEKTGKLKGYDLGVGNALIDFLMNKWYQKPYDNDSKVALKGKVIDKLFNEILKKDAFLNEPIPKSTGKENYNEEFLKNLNIEKYKKEDVIHTLTYYTAFTIKSLLDNETVNKDTKFYIAGGGASNPLMYKYIKEFIPNMEKSSALGIDPQEREAASFAVLGYYYLENKKIGSTTGAKELTIPGCLYKYKK